MSELSLPQDGDAVQDYPTQFHELRLLLSCQGPPCPTAAELRTALESVAKAERDHVDLPDYRIDPLATLIETYLDLAAWVDDHRRAGVECEWLKYCDEMEREIPALVAKLIPWITDAPPEATAEPVVEPMPAEKHLTDQDRAALRKKITEARATDAALATRVEALSGVRPADLPKGPERDAALDALLALADSLDGMGFTNAELNAVIAMTCTEKQEEEGADMTAAAQGSSTPAPQPAIKPDAHVGLVMPHVTKLNKLLEEAKTTGKPGVLFDPALKMTTPAQYADWRAEVTKAIDAGLFDVDRRELDKCRKGMQAAAENANVRDSIAGVAKTGEAPALITNATWEISAIICATANFAVDVGRKLYVFERGVYVPRGEAYIRRRVKAILVDAKKQNVWYKKKTEEVLEYIACDAPALWERPKLDTVNCANGLLEANSPKLMPHTPDFLSPVQLPVRYDPQAECPAIDKFVEQTFPADSLVIAYQIPAWLMTPDTSIQRAVLAVGAGSNGKSTYLSMITAFLGRRNCAAVSLHKLEADRFSVARLVGRLANICPDLPGTDLQSTSLFKSITGGDVIQGERKFADAFEFEPYARLVFSANSLPRSSDASPAFFRRWLVLPFEQRFVEGANAIPRRELDAMLAAPSELSGLLNRALDVLPDLRQRGFTESASTMDAATEFRASTDPMSVWLDKNTIARPEAYVTQDRLFTLYRADCITGGRPTITKTAFGIGLIQARPKVEKKQRTVNGEQAWCYVGIGLLTPEEPPA